MITELMQYEAILFDLDGTLVSSTDLWGEALRSMFATLGIELPAETFKQLYRANLKLKDWIARFGVQETDLERLRPLRDAHYIRLLKERVDWIDGAEDLLASLTETHPLGLVTGSWMSYVNAINTRLPLVGYFKTIITAEKVGDFMKPHPHSLLLAADSLRVDPKKCIYIGDQLFDIEAARNAGMASCCVRGSYTPKEAAEEADFTVESLEELKEIV